MRTIPVPVARPTMGDCANYNGSAIYMQWTPVPDDREHMKGRVKGYKVPYKSSKFGNQKNLRESQFGLTVE